ncbi:pyridoxamine 5'-phosphate oxidase family protein [Streptomyces polygonati]|uniref:Pyridoxamine 5'-phosphate oxidase family protein n=1 Tax=Streptomyces polygonati TaxID=1617087 RepID=A0ABV8HIH3_9ACTN
MAPGMLDPRFSDPAAAPSGWEEVETVLATAGTYWLTTVRADGRPHVTPLIAVWYDARLYFTTGGGEQKARNLAANPRVALTTGSNALKEGLDVVAEGAAVPVTEPALLELLSGAWVAKYGEEWRFEVRDGAFWHEGGGAAGVYEVAPAKLIAFRKGGTYAQTTWRLE